MALQKPTRDESTKAKYEQKTYELTRRCRKSLGIHENEQLDLRQLVGWLISHKTEWARSTWRLYKSAVAYFLERQVELYNDSIAMEALEALMPEGVEGCVKKTQKTSGKKLKKFPLNDFQRILKHLNDNLGDNKWHEPLRRWLVAGILTGLRPTEWANATYTKVGNEDALIVKNAKTTNGRSHGPTRTILLGGLTDIERETIKIHAEKSGEWENSNMFDIFYRSCASALSRVNKILWPKRQQKPSFYSLRHQFSADAKASGLTREEIAALMGHAVDDTATKHYGKKTAGASLTRVKPIHEEVLRIRQTYENRFTGDNEVKPVRKMGPSPTPND